MTDNLIKVLLIDDHDIVRLGVRTLIQKNEDMIVCGESGTLEGGYKVIENIKPDVVLLDMKLPDGDGIIGCRTIKKLSPESKVIILTAYGEDSLIVEVIKVGADGYLLKNIDSKKIISSIRDVANGNKILDQKILNKFIDMVKNKDKNTDNDDILLTKQERNILELISKGKTNKEISSELYVAEKTVRNYVSTILKKINVDNRTEAAMYWMRQKSLF